MKNIKNPLIYVVEDDPAFNKLISSVIKQNGYKRLKSFHTGEEATENIEELPDVVVQDYDLASKMTGLDVIKKFKSLNKEVEFIFLSGQNSIEVAVDAMKHGAFDYIVKDSVAKEKLINKLKKLIYVNRLKLNNQIYKKGLITFGIFWLITVIVIFLLIRFEIIAR